MPRIVGQIDVSKNEAILDAAIEVLGERGLTASMDEIARRAGVSKQTIYNHYGSKIEVVRALTERRVAAITAPLLTPGAEDDPEATLAAYGRALLEIAASPRSVDLLRLAVAHAAEVPDVARTMYEHGARASRLKLGAFLAREHRAGRISAPDPVMAAEVFGGMVIGTRQIAALLGAGAELSSDDIADIAGEAACRFMRAYAPIN